MFCVETTLYYFIFSFFFFFKNKVILNFCSGGVNSYTIYILSIFFYYFINFVSYQLDFSNLIQLSSQIILWSYKLFFSFMSIFLFLIDALNLVCPNRKKINWWTEPIHILGVGRRYLMELVVVRSNWPGIMVIQKNVTIASDAIQIYL